MLSKQEIKELPSEAKVKYYKDLGFLVGENVHIGQGTIIDTDYLVIGDDVEIGRFNDIRGNWIILGSDISFGNNNHIVCANLFEVGSHSNFGSNCDFCCVRFEAGEYLQAYDSIEVGLGGTYNANSWVRLGKACFIGERCILNTSDSIIIGDDVGIGSEVMIWTHGAYLDTTMGFPAKFAPVRIGSHVWLPSRSICLPGVTIGDNVVIGINSLVNRDIPSGCFAAGIPIKILRENEYPLPLTRVDLWTLARNIIDRYLALAKWKEIDLSLWYDPELECFILHHMGYETCFFIREKKIEGAMNDVVEDFRDFLRRNGIKIFTGKRFKSIVPPAYERWLKE